MEKITKNQLKSYIKEIIRESLSEYEYKDFLNEVSPPGKKAERMIHHVKTSLRKAHPDWSEDKITGVAIATGWKAHNAGDVEEIKGDAIPKGKLSQLNPKIVNKGNKKMTIIDPKKSFAQKLLKRLSESGLTITQKKVDKGGPKTTENHKV